MEKFQERFDKFIKKEKLAPADECKNIVAGISGGADSVCLLLMLNETFKDTDVRITAVHVNHNLRKEAKADEEFVRGLCGRLNVELKVFSEDVTGLSEKEGLSLEEAGRKLRYEAFKKVAYELAGKKTCRLPSVKIAVAHHMNDNAETVIFNMLRGSDINGLTGIKPRQTMWGIEVIRPLLFATREEIEQCLRDRGQDFVTDKTNSDTEITRNKIRHEIIPQMLSINPKAVEHIAGEAEGLREAENFIEEKTKELYDRAVEKSGDELLIDSAAIKKSGKFLSNRVIYRAVGEIRQSLKDITRTHVESIYNLAYAESGKRVSLPDGIVAVKEGKNIVLKKKMSKKEPFQVEIKKMEMEKGCIISAPSGEKISLEIVDVTDSNRGEIIKKNECTKAFDYDRISDSIFLGTRTGREKIELQQGIKTLARFFIDQKIPRDRREDCLILRDNDEVIWVLGLRISEKYKIKDTTRKALKVSIIGGCNGQY